MKIAVKVGLAWPAFRLCAVQVVDPLQCDYPSGRLHGCKQFFWAYKPPESILPQERTYGNNPLETAHRHFCYVRIPYQRRGITVRHCVDTAPITAWLRTRLVCGAFAGLFVASSVGCYAPMHTCSIPANTLPGMFRAPERSTAPTLNLASLTLPRPEDYLLGRGDLLEITVPNLYDKDLRPFRVPVMTDGTVNLPLLRPVAVRSMNIAQARDAINTAYEEMYVNPRVTMSLVKKGTIDVTVVGAVATPGVFPIDRDKNDITHALALAGGRTEFAAEFIEVHRRLTPRDYAAGLPTLSDNGQNRRLPPANNAAFSQTAYHPVSSMRRYAPGEEPIADEVVLRIPLRGDTPTMVLGNRVVETILRPKDLELRPGDTIVIPRKKDDVFFVVGPLSSTNAVNFTVTDRDRQLGNGFILPVDRDIDVVTAVVMAGYIDPINSPTTVTVHRSIEGAPPLLVHVDLIKARYDWNENIYVQPGDILYLNPDAAWWSRRTFDRILPELITIPYGEAMQRWILSPVLF